MLRQQEKEINQELRQFDYLKLFMGKINLTEQQDSLIHNLNTQLHNLAEEYSYNKYLLELEQHLSDKYKWERDQYELEWIST